MYNESSICASCAATLQGEMEALKAKTGWDYEIIFCDDGSKDNCADIVRSLNLEGVIVTGYPDNRGKGSAIREAIKASTGDIVIYTDCDLAYGTEFIGPAVEHLTKTDADMLLGSRNLSNDGYEGYTFIRKLASKTYIKVIALFAGFKLSDSQCGFKGFKGDAARKIFSLCTINGFSFDLEAIKIAQRMNLKLTEFPVKILNHRESKVNVVKDAIRMLKDLKIIKKRVKNLKVD